jgi:superfamily II DNA or RNA helicase
MAKPGSIVRLISDPERTGFLHDGERTQAGEKFVQVSFANGKTSWLPESALEEFSGKATDLLSRLRLGEFASPDWLRRALTRIRVTGRLSDIVYSMEATETDFYPFQFKPVLKLLNSPTDALLIADEVGLGKTIEAGLIWTELRARIDAKRLLVVCPKTLCEKWRVELDHRFGVAARVVDARELRSLLNSPTATSSGFAAITSMQSIRPPKGWNDVESDEENRSPRALLARHLDENAEDEPLLDLLVIDEAHHMRNPETLLNQLGSLLNSVSDHRVFLSATPVHLRNRDLFSLLSLIDPDTFSFEETLDELIAVNAPIVRARDLLLNPVSASKDVLQVLAALDDSFLHDSETLAIIKKELEPNEITGSMRAKLASKLEQLNQLANYVTRTRRRDVEEFRVRREVTSPVLEMHDAERTFYDEMTKEVVQYALENEVSQGFLLSTAQRQLTSCPAAAALYWERGAEQPEIEENDRDLEENDDDTRPLVSRLKTKAKALRMSRELAANDSKFQLLLNQLKQAWAEDANTKVIVFSSFIPTLQYLEARLVSKGIGCALMHGSTKTPRDQIIQRFKDDQQTKILLSSEVGSEGVDLQFCWIVISFDLPWNPTRLEQRIGRVDRLGQKKDFVRIINLVYEGTIDAKIYRRLYERLQLHERALGEFEAILGEPIREMEKLLLNPRVSDEEKDRAIAATAQALENLRQQENELESEAASLVQHGDYILEKITEARDQNRWLTGDDILVYVEDRLARDFPGCSIENAPTGTDTYQIRFSDKALETYSRFALRNGIRGPAKRVGGESQHRYRFTSSVVQPRDGVQNISQVHPLVRFCGYLDGLDGGISDGNVIAAQVPAAVLSNKAARGDYVAFVKRWSMVSADGTPSSLSRLSYAGAAVADARPIEPELAEELVLLAASTGKPIPNARNSVDLSQAEQAAALTIEELARRFDDFIADARAEVGDRTRIQVNAIERHRRTKTDLIKVEIEKRNANIEWATRAGDRQRASRLENLAKGTIGKLERLNASCDERLSDIKTRAQRIPEESDVACVYVRIEDWRQ